MNKIANVELKIFLRYLKENNISRKFIIQAQKSRGGRRLWGSAENLKKLINYYNLYSFDTILDFTIDWNTSMNDYDFWVKHHRKIQELFSMNQSSKKTLKIVGNSFFGSYGTPNVFTDYYMPN